MYEFIRPHSTVANRYQPHHLLHRITPNHRFRTGGHHVPRLNRPSNMPFQPIVRPAVVKYDDPTNPLDVQRCITHTSLLEYIAMKHLIYDIDCLYSELYS